MEPEAIVTYGHGVASGRSGDPRFPGRTIALQLPLLRAGVPGLDAGKPARLDYQVDAIAITAAP